MRSIIGRASLGLVCVALTACTAQGVVSSGRSEKTERLAQALTNGNLPAGTTLSVDITTPTNGAVLPAGEVTVSGTATIGEGIPLANTSLVYVLDVSGSTGSTGGCGGDQNGDGSSNTILDCEIAATRALNQQAIISGTIGEVGVVAFGRTAVTGDVGPGGGALLVTGPSTDGNTNGTADVEEVLAAARIGQLQQFTVVTADSGATSYGAALGAAATVLGAATKPNKVVIFLSDGFNNTGPSVATALASFPSDATVHTFAVGTSASCAATSTFGRLEDISAARSGSCTNVPNVAALPDVLPAVVASRLTRVSLTVDGSPVPDPTVVPALPQLGPKSVGWTTSVGPLAPGSHTLCATAHGSDAGGTGTVTDCVTVLVNSPPTAKCKNVTVSADATCSATASIDDNSFDPDGDGFTCTQVPTGATGVGTTTATLTCTDVHGATSTCTATITVTDATAPTVTTTGTPISLWPPDHTYRSFSLADCITSITDNCGTLDVATAAQIVRIESDEGESANGTGSTCDDAIITSPTTCNLRAERAGNGDGRVYTVHFAVTDASGGVTPGTCVVQVVKSQSAGNATAVNSGCAYCVGTGCGTCAGPSPTCF